MFQAGLLGRAGDLLRGAVPGTHGARPPARSALSRLDRAVSSQTFWKARKEVLFMVSKATMRFPDDDDGRQTPRRGPSLKQWARLYRAASRVGGLDSPGLERLAQRLYQKPLAELSMLEAAGLIGMLKAA